MRHATEIWIRSAFEWFSVSGMNPALMASVATTLRIPVRNTYETGGISDQIFAVINGNDNLYLDCLDLLLSLRAESASSLREILSLAGSVWTVADSDRCLERRVSPESRQAMRSATSVPDATSAELQDAWKSAYGRNPNPSDAWDHAIKAVEDLLIPIVIPRKAKPNLGGVAGVLKAESALWSFGLKANGDLDQGRTLEALIRLMWPNPDRHGGTEDKRAPTPKEAEQVVQIAITIVALCRGNLSRRLAQ